MHVKTIWPNGLNIGLSVKTSQVQSSVGAVIVSVDKELYL